MRVVVAAAFALTMVAGVWSQEKATGTKAPPAPADTGAARPGAEDGAQKKETLEEIVARVRRRLAGEMPVRASRATAPPPSPRIKLVWRATVVWPTELAGESGAPGERVTLSWDADSAVTITDP